MLPSKCNVFGDISSGPIALLGFNFFEILFLIISGSIMISDMVGVTLVMNFVISFSLTGTCSFARSPPIPAKYSLKHSAFFAKYSLKHTKHTSNKWIMMLSF